MSVLVIVDFGFGDGYYFDGKVIMKAFKVK